MNILLDNIIFSLQKSGGASVVWQQHIERILKDRDFQCQFLEYENADLNFFRKHLSIDNELIDVKSKQFIKLNRYLNLNSKVTDKHLFHSSYYRVEKGKNSINVTTVHDFTYEHFISGLSQKVHTWQKNLAINSSDGIICISESTKKDLLNFLPHIDPKKIKVIYNGVDEDFKPLAKDVIFDKKHPFKDYEYAIYVGDRKSAYKNFAMAVEACMLANIPLVMIGGGILSDLECNFLKNKLGLGKFSILLGVEVQDLNYYYNKALFLLYPSLYEGFGIPVVEAQKAGCPVITTNSSSIPEVIGNMYLAINNPTPQLIFKKMQELSINSNLRSETIDLGFEKSKQFSWNETYDKTKEFYEELYNK
ncbi:glycosyltransferase family 4 protein [Flavobacterium hercynium]|uniref:Glycosyltransferase n=1 Tax=Flavobacterium hercynium TaxID=387094 RepID=A0A226HD26_9FLAO|nr:glycosyltransferase family 1 protein [Flavobacterium hercynium]OXA92193.1 hypothetical protein B0A66_10535 [Flavobacterium hercynium]SMP24528.1 mannosyltransferase [Flavobacterium hercynium]